MLNDIEFSENWNGKLLLDHFTTIRLETPEKYIEGKHFEVRLRGELLGVAKLTIVHPFRYEQLNDRTALIDCGKNQQYLQTLLSRFYGPMPPGRKLYLLFFEWKERKFDTQRKMIRKHWEHCMKQMPQALQQQMEFDD